MCIIVVKPIGVSLPPKKVFETCFWNNPDGAGIMYNNKENVFIEKGYMSFSAFWKEIQRMRKKFVMESMSIVFHFRIGTQGANDVSNCHPFPLSDKTEDLVAPRIRTKIGIVHNGIIPLTSSYKKEEKYSDTHYFIKDYMSLIVNDKTFYYNPKTMKLLERLVESKLAILDEDGNVTTIGKFIEDENGCLFSNASYVSYAVSSQNYSFNYSINKITVMPIDSYEYYAVPFKSKKDEKIWELVPTENFVDRFGNIYRWSYLNPQFIVKISGFYAVKGESNKVTFNSATAYQAEVIEFLSDYSDDEMDEMLSEEELWEDEYRKELFEDYYKLDDDLLKKEALENNPANSYIDHAGKLVPYTVENDGKLIKI